MAGSMEALNRSLDFDWRLWREDVRGSRVWARALERAGVLSEEELGRILGGLDRVSEQLAAANGPDDFADEDIHTVVERLLTEAAGRVGGKLHTGRSRNDQAATGFRLWAMSAVDRVVEDARTLGRALLGQARRHTELLMPGYTHTQPAQPVPAAHWIASRAWPLARDIHHWKEARSAIDSCPLGAGAIAGCAFNVDREAIAAELGFSRAAPNSIDAVGDRDWCARTIFAAALTGVHVSQLAEDLVLFSSPGFGFVRIADAYSTGSSLMPQKKNPDAAELARGRAGRLIGNVSRILVLLKGLPTGYNRDLQEDKEAVFDAFDSLETTLPAMAGMVESIELDGDAMARSLSPELLATDLAEELVRRGVPFRESHRIVGSLVRIAADEGLPLTDLDEATVRGAHAELSPKMIAELSPKRSAHARRVLGGAAPSKVREQLDDLARALEP